MDEHRNKIECNITCIDSERITLKMREECPCHGRQFVKKNKHTTLLPDPSRAHWPRILEDIHYTCRFVNNEIAKVATGLHGRVCEYSHSRSYSHFRTRVC